MHGLSKIQWTASLRAAVPAHYITAVSSRTFISTHHKLTLVWAKEAPICMEWKANHHTRTEPFELGGLIPAVLLIWPYPPPCPRGRGVHRESWPAPSCTPGHNDMGDANSITALKSLSLSKLSMQITVEPPLKDYNYTTVITMVWPPLLKETSCPILSKGSSL